MLLLYFLLLMISNKCACIEVPVFFIDNNKAIDYLNPFKTALSLMKRSEFTEILHETIRKSEMIIIFIEDYLSVEDISSKDSSGTLYPNLQKALHENKIVYLSAVEDPYTVLKQMFQPSSKNTFNISICNVYSDIESINTDSSYIYINLVQLSNETRAESIRNHDFIIKEILASHTRGSVLSFYTGRRNPIKALKYSKPHHEPRVSRIVMGQDEVFVSSNEMIYYLSGILYKSSMRSEQIEIPYHANENWISTNALRTSMTFSNFEIKFDFTFGSSFWRIDKVHLFEGGEEVGLLRMGVGAPIGYSFFCADPIVLVNSRDGSHVTIQKYQILPLSTAESFRKWDRSLYSIPKVITRQSNDAYLFLRALRTCETTNCGQYFQDITLAIIFVVFILLTIFSFGLTAIMNLSTNDRYDDPHGKPIHVTSET